MNPTTKRVNQRGQSHLIKAYWGEHGREAKSQMTLTPLALANGEGSRATSRNRHQCESNNRDLDSENGGSSDAK
jgi:hypothetical protein